MAVDGVFTWIEQDVEFKLTFFYCQLCPLTIPFLEPSNAWSYLDGHELNSYHKRRLELLR